MALFPKVDEAWRDVEYEKKVFEYLHTRVPDKVFDAHSHCSKGEVHGVADDNVFEAAHAATEKAIGKGKIKGGITMGNPFVYETEEEYKNDRLFSCENAKEENGFVTGLLVRPSDDPEDVKRWIEKYPRITALKPYWTYLKEPEGESDMIDYAPEWMWKIADMYGLVVVMHISRYDKSLSNEKNAKTIRYLCKKYPNATMQLAHCGLGHDPYWFKNGLKCLDGLENVWMDMSGIAEPLTLIYAFQEFDRKKLMYGTDGYNYGHNMFGRCMHMAGKFIGVYSGTEIPGLFEPPYLFKGVSTMTENLLATFAAGDVVGLSQSEYEDIFYNNAARLHYPKIRK